MIGLLCFVLAVLTSPFKSRMQLDAGDRAPRLPGDLESQIAHFVDHYNHCHYHESLQNLTPADVYFGRRQTILLVRERIKRDTIKQRGLQFRW